MTEITGHCLCGNVSYRITAEPILAAHCHCINCRKSSLTGHGSFFAVPKEAATFSGETSSFDMQADSGNIVTKHFCPTCGSPVYNESSGRKEMYMLPGSLLDDPDIMKPQVTVYASRAVSWDQPAADIPSFPKMPPRP